MDVSIVTLPNLSTPGNGWLSDSPILLFAHLWSNAGRLTMNLKEIRPPSNICQRAVSAAFNTKCLQASALYHIMWRRELFSEFIGLLCLFFFFYPHCEKFHAHACEVSWVRRWNYNECNGLGVIDFKFSDLILNSEIKISDCWCCRSPTLQEIVKNVTAKVTETELP